MTSKPQPGEFCWNDLMTSNVDVAKDFYQNLLGWTYQEHTMEDSCGGNYTMIQCGDKSIGGIMQTPPQAQDIPPHWMSYISVENLDAIIEKALILGASIVKPITSVKDYGRLAVIKDPTGAHIAFWQCIKEC